MFTQIPGGLLSRRFGGKCLFGYGILGTALLTIATPLAANTDVRLLIALRVLAGFVEVCANSDLSAIGRNFRDLLMS